MDPANNCQLEIMLFVKLQSIFVFQEECSVS